MSADNPVNSGTPGASDEKIAMGDTEVVDTRGKSEVDVLNEGVDDSEEAVVPDTSEEVTPAEDDIKEAKVDEEEKEQTEEELEKEFAEEGKEEDQKEDDLSLDDDDDDLDESKILRSSWQMIKEKYPDLAKNKDFKEMYFSERAYRDLFPTVQDAREAAQATEAFNVISESLVDGNMEVLFKSMNEETLETVSSKFLPSLYKHNPKFFRSATQPLIIDVLHNVHDRAVQSKDDNLRISVRNISKVLTGDYELPTRKEALPPEVEKERDALRQERNRLAEKESREFTADIDRKVLSKLTSMVERGFPKDKRVTSFTRDAVIERTLNDVKSALSNDQNLVRRLTNLYNQAHRAGYTNEYKSRIAITYLERARRLITSARDKHLKAALGEQPNRANGESKVVTTNEDVRTSKGSHNVRSGRDIDTSKTSAEDFLHDRNVHVRR